MALKSWSISAGDPWYPQHLAHHARLDDWRTLFGVGQRKILERKCLGLICSVKCPGDVVIKTFDAIRALRDAGVVIACGFHSSMERECLDFLLRGKQPVIICPAKHVGSGGFPPDWRSAIDAERLLVISPFADKARRTTKAQAVMRNRFVAALASAVLIPHASPGGIAAAVANEIQRRSQPVFTFADPENTGMMAAGARDFSLPEISTAISVQTE